MSASTPEVVVAGTKSAFRASAAATDSDFRSELHRLIVEFDGDEHYRSARKILRDQERDAVFLAAGYRVIRIPYFVQLKRAVIVALFGDAAEDFSDFQQFPHGFIAKTVVMPADFCELGITFASETGFGPLQLYPTGNSRKAFVALYRLTAIGCG